MMTPEISSASKRRASNGAAIILSVLWLAGLESLWGQTSTQQLFEEAQAARARGDLAQAEQKYREVIQQEPQVANAYQNLGNVYFTERKYREAIPVLEQALKIDPRLGGAYFILGLAHYQLYDSTPALAAFKSALRLNPSDTNALFYLGKAQMQARDYRGSVLTFEKLKARKPRDPDVLYNLSLAHMKLMLEAVNDLGEVAPHSYQFWLLLAQDADARGDDAAAIHSYQEALCAKPNATGAHYGLGSAYARAGKYDLAGEEFRKELQFNPNDSLALWKWGELSLHTDPEEAREVLERAVKLNPDFPQAVLAYGRALARTGDMEKAVEQYLRVTRLAPEEDTVHYLLASTYRKLGREREAKAEIARFEELAKKKSEKRMQMARELIDMSRTAQELPENVEPGFSPSHVPEHP